MKLIYKIENVIQSTKTAQHGIELLQKAQYGLITVNGAKIPVMENRRLEEITRLIEIVSRYKKRYVWATDIPRSRNFYWYSQSIAHKILAFMRKRLWWNYGPNHLSIYWMPIQRTIEIDEVMVQGTLSFMKTEEDHILQEIAEFL